MKSEVLSSTSSIIIPTYIVVGGVKEGIGKSNETDASIAVTATSLCETDSAQKMASVTTSAETGNTVNVVASLETAAEGTSAPATSSFLENGSTNLSMATPSSNEIQVPAKATIDLNQASDPCEEGNMDAPGGAAAASSSNI